MVIYYLAALTAMGEGIVPNSSEILSEHLAFVAGSNFVNTERKKAPALAKDNVAAIPLGNPGEWVTTYDYPVQALREQRQGTVGFSLQISSQGMVTSCEITASSGSPMLDEETCRLITLRAKFTPAKNAKGFAIRSKYRNRVRWQIPQSKANALTNIPAPEQVTSTLSYMINVDGSISDCKFVSDKLVIEPNTRKSPCDMDVTFKPYKNAAGKIVPVRVVYANVIKVTELPGVEAAK